MTGRLQDLRRTALVPLATYGGAILAGMAGTWLGLPLPWMSGALVWSMALRLWGAEVSPIRHSRQAGQVLIGSSIGLSFTPEAFGLVVSMLVPMLASALMTVAAAFAAAALAVRATGIDVVTATLASLPIGPVESTSLARKHGVDPGPVIFAQISRIMLLVLIVPAAIVALDGRVGDPSAVLRAMEWHTAGAVLTGVLAVGGAMAARLLGMANPFFIGAIAGASAGAVAGLPLSAYPYPLLVAAQLFLGVWLGAAFDRALLRRAGRFIPAAALSSMVLIVLCVAQGLLLAWVTGLSWQTMVLATAPGGTTEMSLTAKILQEGLALVTAFQIIRIFLILPFAPTIARLTARLSRHGG